MSNDLLLYHNPENGLTYVAGGDLNNCTVSVCPAEYSIYGYRPSLAFSGTIIGLYAVCLAVQLYLGIRSRKWGFMSAMAIGCLCEIIGYVGRILYWQNPWGDAGFYIQIVVITFSPVFFAAAIYVMIYQIAMYISKDSARFHPKYFYWIFIPCDILSLVLQAVGGSLSSASNGSDDNGVNIALAGLCFQVATLVFFVVAVVDYMICSRPVWSQTKLPKRFINFCVFLFLATVFILVRCAYRVYELNEGYSLDSEALRDETLFNVLEGIMVILAAWCLVVAHPGFVFKQGKTLMEPSEKDLGAESSDMPGV